MRGASARMSLPAFLFGQPHRIRLDPCHWPASSSVIRSIGVSCARQCPEQQPPPRVACSALLRQLGIHLHAPSPPPRSPRGISVRAPFPFPTVGTGRRLSSPQPPPLCRLTSWTYAASLSASTPRAPPHPLRRASCRPLPPPHNACTDVEAAFIGDQDDEEVEGGDLGAASDTKANAMFA